MSTKCFQLSFVLPIDCNATDNPIHFLQLSERFYYTRMSYFYCILINFRKLPVNAVSNTMSS